MPDPVVTPSVAPSISTPPSTPSAQDTSWQSATARTLEGLPEGIKKNPIPLDEDNKEKIKQALDGNTNKNTPKEMEDIFQTSLNQVLESEEGKRLDNQQKATLLRFYEQQYQNLMNNIQQLSARQAFSEQNDANVGSNLKPEAAFYGDFSRGDFSNKPFKDFQSSRQNEEALLKGGELTITASRDGKEFTANIKSDSSKNLLEHHKDAIRTLSAKGCNQFNLEKISKDLSPNELKELVKEAYKQTDKPLKIGLNDIPKKLRTEAMEKDLDTLYNQRNELREQHLKEQGKNPRFNSEKFSDNRESYNSERTGFKARGQTQDQLTGPTAGAGRTLQLGSHRNIPDQQPDQSPAAASNTSPSWQTATPTLRR